MAYLKKQFRRAKKFFKKRYTGKGTLHTMQRVIRDVNMIKGLVNSELKYKDFAGSSTIAVGTAGGWSYVSSLNTITQGDAASEREGSQVRIKSLQVKYNIERAAGNHRVKAMILLDRTPLVGGVLGTVASPSDVYRDPTDLDSMRDWNGIQQRRFKVLYSKVFEVSADELITNGKFYKKMSLPVTWNSTSTVGTDITSNRLYMIFMSDNVTASDVNVNWEGRITYRDN